MAGMFLDFIRYVFLKDCSRLKGKADIAPTPTAYVYYIKFLNPILHSLFYYGHFIEWFQPKKCLQDIHSFFIVLS